MEKFLGSEMYDAYLEMCLGVMALRVPEIQTILTKTYPGASIESSYPNQHLNLNIVGMLEEIRKQGLVEPKNLRNAFSEINKIFLVSSWELLRETTTYNAISTQPDIQFLRHVRNGCAHNKFNFTELKHPAKWRDKEITMGMVGDPVFPTFLKDGDPILLLIDINNRYYDKLDVSGYVPHKP